MKSETIRAVHNLMLAATEASDAIKNMSSMLDGTTKSRFTKDSVDKCAQLLMEYIAKCSQSLSEELGDDQTILRTSAKRQAEHEDIPTRKVPFNA